MKPTSEQCFFHKQYLHCPCSGAAYPRVIGDDNNGFSTMILCDNHTVRQRSTDPLPYKSSTNRPRISTSKRLPIPREDPPSQPYVGKRQTIPSFPAPPAQTIQEPFNQHGEEVGPRYTFVSPERKAKVEAQRKAGNIETLLKGMKPRDRRCILEKFCLFCGEEVVGCKC